MTAEEFEKQMSVLMDKERLVHQEMRKLHKAFISSYHIQPGDKCMDGRGTTCWLSKIYFSNITSINPHFMVNYAKKDGTPSKRDEIPHGKITKVTTE